ncbi:AAA family ATPase [Vibrio diabolicus]|uniref:AAA family ATPase n=1 Tax=Vibrio diabolicus TaxID=50719 RepID=UPI00215DE45E|nr:ATP-binding protein [Vibrio diabolicus]MCS0411117.1 ATP-binding protein [Vibrio diabolicus]MDV5044021.1 ATP-binding protein [Vibrio diabolicus]
MLVYFSVENYKSIDEKLELNLKTAPRLRRLPHHAVAPTTDSSLKVLRSAVMYGANASGKSNIIKAIKFAQSLVTGQQRNRRNLKLEPFKLTKNIKKETSFYFEFTYGDALFAYGFTLEGSLIINEYMYHLDKEEQYCFFERVLNENNSYDINTDMYNDSTISSDELDDLIKLIKYSSNEELFVQEAHSKDYVTKLDQVGSVFIPVLYFFFSQLIVIFPDTFYGSLGQDLSSESKSSCKYIELLNRFDTGVSGLRSENVNLSAFPEEIIMEVEDSLDDGHGLWFIHFKGEDYRFEYDEDKNIIASKVVSIHKLKDGSEVTFELEQESDGTRRILDLLPALANGTIEDQSMSFTYIIDEFDRSLHPNLSKAFLDAFLNESLSSEQNQLIVTTHESSLMDTKLLRRDSIWFVQKEEDHSTQLYSLNDYSPRFDKDIRNAYLSGVYGAVPYLNSGF